MEIKLGLLCHEGECNTYYLYVIYVCWLYLCFYCLISQVDFSVRQGFVTMAVSEMKIKEEGHAWLTVTEFPLMLA